MFEIIPGKFCLLPCLQQQLNSRTFAQCLRFAVKLRRVRNMAATGSLGEYVRHMQVGVEAVDYGTCDDISLSGCSRQRLVGPRSLHITAYCEYH